MKNYNVYIPNKPHYDEIRESLLLCNTEADLVKFAHYCLDRSETSLGDYRKAFFKTANGIFYLFTARNLYEKLWI